MTPKQPRWSEIIAINVNTGEVAWRKPLGDIRRTDRAGCNATGTPQLRGRAIVTAGGVVFIGTAIDAPFCTCDARTGKQIWRTKLVDAAKATPITYPGKSSQQYVAILAGGGETEPPDNPGRASVRVGVCPTLLKRRTNEKDHGSDRPQ